jgi:hypothetical protein
MIVHLNIGFGVFTFSIFVEAFFLNISFLLTWAVLFISGIALENQVLRRFFHSVKLHREDVTKRSKLVLSDNTVQENNATFPTDAKLCKKVIDKYNKLAEKLEISQRQRYTRISKQLLRDTYNAKHPKRVKKANKARKRLKTIANTLIRELERKMRKSQFQYYEKELSLYK